MASGFGGNPHFRWFVWETKKKLQVLVRTHLSHTLAALLAVLVVIREWPELFKAMTAISWFEWVFIWDTLAICAALGQHLWRVVTLPPGASSNHIRTVVFMVFGIYLAVGYAVPAAAKIPKFDLAIIFLTVATLFAAAWEFRGHKLPSSQQELYFPIGVRELLTEIDAFCFDKQLSMEELVRKFLAIARNSVCGDINVNSCWMMPKGDSLQIIAVPYGVNPPELTIPLPKTGKDTGPAGWAFDQMELVYMPEKEWQESWPFKNVQGRYIASPAPKIGWIKANPENNTLRSSLNVPVTVRQSDGTTARFGVLTLETEAPDPFVDRDFVIAECLAAILSLALTFNLRVATDPKT